MSAEHWFLVSHAICLQHIFVSLCFFGFQCFLASNASCSKFLASCYSPLCYILSQLNGMWHMCCICLAACQNMPAQYSVHSITHLSEETRHPPLTISPYFTQKSLYIFCFFKFFKQAMKIEHDCHSCWYQHWYCCCCWYHQQQTLATLSVGLLLIECPGEGSKLERSRLPWAWRGQYQLVRSSVPVWVGAMRSSDIIW